MNEVRHATGGGYRVCPITTPADYRLPQQTRVRCVLVAVHEF